MQLSTVTFIGLGNMGAPMATNMAKAGHIIRGYDVSGAQADGVVSCSSLEEAVQDTSIIITMLPDGPIMRSVISLALSYAPTDTLFIDCSTVDVASARAAAEEIVNTGHAAIDAPVSGGTAGAMAGTLTFMVGGDKDAYARAEPFLEIMGARLPLRGKWRRPGRKDLQQHDPWHLDDRDLRSFCSGGRAEP